MITPTVHLNGTGKETLVEQHMQAYQALMEAYGLMCDAAPHARDYMDREALSEAKLAHYTRTERVLVIADEYAAIALGISEQ